MAIIWDRVKLATTSDKDLTQLVSIIESGFPESRHEIPPALQEYYQFRKHLYTVDGVILYKDRIVIPPSLRQHILDILHSAHQGVTSMTARAESSAFWPGITPAITALRANCCHCNTMAPSQPSAPPFPPTTPVYPFQSICADFFQHKGFNYLVVVQYRHEVKLLSLAAFCEKRCGIILCSTRMLSFSRMYTGYQLMYQNSSRGQLKLNKQYKQIL